MQITFGELSLHKWDLFCAYPSAGAKDKRKMRDLYVLKEGAVGRYVSNYFFIFCKSLNGCHSEQSEESYTLICQQTFNQQFLC